jgi:Protein of unknown function (DUF1706)
MNEEDLIGPQRFAWMKGNPLYYLVAGDTYEHYEEHSKPIREWLVNPKQD